MNDEMGRQGYVVQFHTGTGNLEGFETIDEAKMAADKSASYTQQPITIKDASGNEVARRPWYGVEYNADEHDQENPILFGDYGFYGDWY